MPVEYEQTLRLSKRLRVGTQMLSYLVNEARKFGQKLDFATLERPGRSHQIDTESELKDLTEADVLQAHELTLFFESDDGEWSIYLERQLSSGPNSPGAHPSYIRSSSKNYHFAHSLVGLRAQLESLFQDKQPPDENRFTSCAVGDTFLGFDELNDPPLAFGPIDNDSVIAPKQTTTVALPIAERESTTTPVALSQQEMPAKQRSWLKPTLILGAMVAALTLWQAVSGSHQVDTAKHQASTGDKQLSLESSALFEGKKIDSSPFTEEKERLIKHHEEPFSFQIQNVGRATATSVHLRCGEKEDRGLYADLGTIAPGQPLTVRSWLAFDKGDVMHERDRFCMSAVYLIYDDRSGHHVISFDRAGNALPLEHDGD